MTIRWHVNVNKVRSGRSNIDVDVDIDTKTIHGSACYTSIACVDLHESQTTDHDRDVYVDKHPGMCRMEREE